MFLKTGVEIGRRLFRKLSKTPKVLFKLALVEQALRYLCHRIQSNSIYLYYPENFFVLMLVWAKETT